MSETILAALVGAFIGGLLTQLTLFWLNDRKEKQARRRLALEYVTRALMGLEQTLLDILEDRGEGRDRLMDRAIETVNSLSDDEISIMIATSKILIARQEGNDL